MLQSLVESQTLGGVPSDSLPRDRVSLLGVQVDRVSFDDVLQRVESFVAARAPRRIVTVNLDYISLAHKDASFRETLNDADLAIADGMPLVWASRWTAAPLPQRVAGQDLFDSICRLGG